MQFRRITLADDPALDFIQQLYEQAFPPHERRKWAQLKQMVSSAQDMHLDLVFAETHPIGFIVWWEIQSGYFIEFFAIDAKLRGQNYGAAVLQAYHERLSGNIVLEVEHPEHPDAVRRIRFYERLGYTALDISYEQPDYDQPGITYPMLLLGRPGFDPSALPAFAENIKQKVYFAFLA